MSIFIIATLYADSFLFPGIQTAEIVLKKKEIVHTARKRASVWFVYTLRHRYYVDFDLYASVSAGDTVIISRSGITHATRTITSLYGDYSLTEDLRILSDPSHIIVTLMIFAAALLMPVNFKRFTYKTGRMAAAVGFFVITMIMIVLYFING